MTIYRTLETDGVPAPSDVELEMLDRDHGMGVTIDIPCPCKGTGIVKRNGRTVYCRCAEGFEAAMAEQVELMTAYAEQLRLYDEAQRRGYAPPFRAAEYVTIHSLYRAAEAEHDWIEARWQLLYG